ncbi:MAG TPA: plastocyanin/azurin family copper-binding protein [Lacunisphaera sp.]|jgi:azurin
MKSIARILIALTGLFTFSLLHAADAPASARVINLHAGVGNAMKFDVTAITATPGETIKVVLTNASNLPKTVMGHNWILLKAGTDPVAFAQTATSEGATGYIPAKLEDKIIAHINLLGPGESGEVVFTAPTEPGAYPFLCSFPGHCAVGMRGVLTVKK